MSIERDPAAELLHSLLTRLKVRQLALLQAIGRYRRLSRVAAEMKLSQPAITKALREVEGIFDTVLFERTSQGLLPTPCGEAVLHYAGRWLAELEATTRVLTSLQAGRGGRIRLGLTHQVPQQLLCAALSHLLDRSPRMAVLTREGTTDELVAGLLAREIDCAIGRSYDGDATGIAQEAVYEQQPCLVVGAKSVKRMSRGPLDWAQLAKLDWILPPPSTPMRRAYNAVFIGAGVQPPVPMLESMSIRSMEMVLQTQPNAISIVARDTVVELARGGTLAALPYRLDWNLPPVSFFTLTELKEHPTVLSLGEVVRKTAKDMQRQAKRGASS